MVLPGTGDVLGSLLVPPFPVRRSKPADCGPGAVHVCSAESKSSLFPPPRDGQTRLSNAIFLLQDKFVYSNLLLPEENIVVDEISQFLPNQLKLTEKSWKKRVVPVFSSFGCTEKCGKK